MNIANLHMIEDQKGGLRESNLKELHHKLSTHRSLLKQQETLWRQKSRIQRSKMVTKILGSSIDL